jgi:hypothetical protein
VRCRPCSSVSNPSNSTPHPSMQCTHRCHPPLAHHPWPLETTRQCAPRCAGRPEKLPDVCYSWWVLSSLSIVERLEWISSYKLQVPSCGSQHAEASAVLRHGRTRSFAAG